MVGVSVCSCVCIQILVWDFLPPSTYKLCRLLARTLNPESNASLPAHFLSPCCPLPAPGPCTRTLC